MKTNLPTAEANHKAYTPRAIALSLLLMILLVALTGCKHDTPASSAPDPAGVYALVSVDNKSLPCELNHEGTSMTIKSGVFTINADGTCRSLMNFSVPQRGDMSREVKATYTQAGAELTMQWEGAGITKGNVDGNSFTMINEGMTLSYRK